MMNDNYSVFFNSYNDEDEFLLTIAIPTYNRFALLNETLKSCFIQNFIFPVEVIIVDNNSIELKERHEFIAKNKKLGRFKYVINHENLGMFGNWNQCLSLAKGKYITILHDDDVFNDNFSVAINRMFPDMTEGSIPIFGFDSYISDERLKKSEKINNVSNNIRQKKYYSKIDFFISNRFNGTLSVVMDRKKSIALGGFIADWAPVADYEFWCRWTTSISGILKLNDKVAVYRINENESMKKEVQDAFIYKSNLLRNYLIDSKKVPKIMRHTIYTLMQMQKHSVNCIWGLEESTKSVGIFSRSFIKLISFFAQLKFFNNR
ncbi:MULTISPECIES: glycosyltransferase family 2 protein [Pectobacterium]|uniref:glycosyltransferase family 2 protein n=1 Tax=Pectobacterium TaxID=122277 RepID=UPI001F11E879|nr:MULTISPECIES: glycosyltransferase family 2 protein [Pectobacterium]